MHTFNTLAQLKLAKLSVAQFTTTAGREAAGDGDEATYYIEAPGTADERGDHTLANGNIARLVPTNMVVHARQFGAKGDGIVDDSAALLALADYDISSKGRLLPAGEYNCPTGDFTGVDFYSYGDASITNNATATIIDLVTPEAPDKSIPIKVVTSGYAVTLADEGTMLVMDDPALATLNIPDTLTTGYNFLATNRGGGGLELVMTGTNTVLGGTTIAGGMISAVMIDTITLQTSREV